MTNKEGLSHPDKSRSRANLSKMSEGIQLLREYIFYNKFNFNEMCMASDDLHTGAIKREDLKREFKENN